MNAELERLASAIIDHAEHTCGAPKTFSEALVIVLADISALCDEADLDFHEHVAYGGALYWLIELNKRV